MEPIPATKTTIKAISILPTAEYFRRDEYGVISAHPAMIWFEAQEETFTKKDFLKSVKLSTAEYNSSEIFPSSVDLVVSERRNVLLLKSEFALVNASNQE